MKINNITWFVSFLAFVGSPAFAAASDAPAVQPNQQTVYTDPTTGVSHRNTGQGTPMAVMPPAGWKDLSGKIQSFDRTSQTLQLRDKDGVLYLIPVDGQLSITRKGKGITFSQIQKGEFVHLHMIRP